MSEAERLFNALAELMSDILNNNPDWIKEYEKQTGKKAYQEFIQEDST